MPLKNIRQNLWLKVEDKKEGPRMVSFYTLVNR